MAEHEEARKAALREMLATPGWGVALQALAAMRDTCATLLVGGSYEAAEDLLKANRLQAEHALLTRLLEKPEEVLLGQSESKPSQPMRLGAGRNIR